MRAASSRACSHISPLLSYLPAHAATPLLQVRPHSPCILPPHHAFCHHPRCRSGMLVPLIAGNIAPAGYPPGEGACNAGGAYLQNNTIAGLEGLYTWAQSEPRIAGFCPWHYNDRCVCMTVAVRLSPTTSSNPPLATRGIPTSSTRRHQPSHHLHPHPRPNHCRCMAATPPTNCTDGHPPCDMDVGAVSLPLVAAQLRQMGTAILNGGV
jgi:hypothetical protein